MLVLSLIFPSILLVVKYGEIDMADVIVHVDRVSVADVTEDTPEGRGGKIAVFVGKLEAVDSKALKD